MGLGQWWGLQELVFGCTGRLICSELDHAIAVATYHVQLSGGDQLVVGYTSVSIALVTFISILAYHIFQ